MGLPFNFFGFTELPFILQGSFLFDDDWDLDWNWTGTFTGINKDNYHLNFNWSGEYFRDVGPEAYTVDWKWSGRFSGVHDEFVAHSFNPYGESSGVFTEAAFLLFNTTGEYIREKQDDSYIGNTLDHVEMKKMDQNHFDFRIEVPKVEIYDIISERCTLSSTVPKVVLKGGDSQGLYESAYIYDFNLNGIYQKDPAQ